jgi:dsDNA-binding SOS-regulon protein
MHRYQRESEEIVRQFLEHKITFAQCVASLDAALANLTPKLRAEQRECLRMLVARNHDAMTREISRRESLECVSSDCWAV